MVNLFARFDCSWSRHVACLSAILAHFGYTGSIAWQIHRSRVMRCGGDSSNSIKQKQKFSILSSLRCLNTHEKRHTQLIVKWSNNNIIRVCLPVGMTSTLTIHSIAISVGSSSRARKQCTVVVGNGTPKNTTTTTTTNMRRSIYESLKANSRKETTTTKISTQMKNENAKTRYIQTTTTTKTTEERKKKQHTNNWMELKGPNLNHQIIFLSVWRLMYTHPESKHFGSAIKT